MSDRAVILDSKLPSPLGERARPFHTVLIAVGVVIQLIKVLVDTEIACLIAAVHARVVFEVGVGVDLKQEVNGLVFHVQLYCEVQCCLATCVLMVHVSTPHQELTAAIVVTIYKVADESIMTQLVLLQV